MWGDITNTVEIKDINGENLVDLMKQACRPNCLPNYDIPSRMNDTRKIT